MRESGVINLPPDDRPGPRSHRGARVWLTLDGNVSGIFGDNDGAIPFRAVETPRGFRAKAHPSRSLALGTTDQDGEHNARVSPGARDARRACGEMKWRGPPRRADTVSEVIDTFGVSWRVRRSRKMPRATRQRRSSSAVLAVLLETPSPRPPRVIVLAPAPARGAARTRVTLCARGDARASSRAHARRSRSPPVRRSGVSFPTPSPRSADEDAAPSGGIRPSPGRDGVDPRRDPLPPPRRTARAHRPGGRGGRALRRAQQLPNAITSVVRPRAPSRLPFVLLVRDARCLTQTRSLRHASTPFIRPPRLTRHPPPLDRSQDRLTHEQRLYLFCDASTSPRGGPSVLLGILKVGCKNLFVTRFDDDRVVEIEPCCVLDFYVHEAAQRGGIGGELFHHFLAAETQVPARLAYDRPSPKLLAFLAKRFHLRARKPQNNNYVVFRDYWRVGPRPASAAKAAMKEMGGRGGLAAAARAKAAAARAAAAEARRFAGVDLDATRNPSPRFASTTDPSTSRRGSAGPRAPPTPPGIEPARGSRGTDDFTARSSVGFDKPRRVARPARRFADGFADAVDARVGHVSDVRPSNRTSTRGVDTPREDARGGARVPDWKTTAKEATSVDREGASVDREERRSTSSFAPRRPPRLGSPISTRRVARPVTFPSRRRRNLSTIRIVVFDLRAARRLAIRSLARRLSPPRARRARVAGVRRDRTSETRRRTSPRTPTRCRHRNGGLVRTGTQVRRVRASPPSRGRVVDGFPMFASRFQREGRIRSGGVPRAWILSRARARTTVPGGARVSLPTVRRAVAPGGCGDASVRRRRRDVARAARTVGKSGDDEDGRSEILPERERRSRPGSGTRAERRSEGRDRKGIVARRTSGSRTARDRMRIGGDARGSTRFEVRGSTPKRRGRRWSRPRSVARRTRRGSRATSFGTDAK